MIEEGLKNEYYEASFKDMADHGHLFRAVDTTQWPAIEIDSADDLERARKLEAKNASAQS